MRETITRSSGDLTPGDASSTLLYQDVLERLEAKWIDRAVRTLGHHLKRSWNRDGATIRTFGSNRIEDIGRCDNTRLNTDLFRTEPTWILFTVKPLMVSTGKPGKLDKSLDARQDRLGKARRY